MKATIKTQTRLGERPRRRKRKQPGAETLLRVEWLNWLVETYGADAVAEWQDPPVTFHQWRLERELAAHEAA